MKTLFFFSTLLVVSISTLAQAPQTVTLDNNNLSAKDIKPELQFLFPDFQNGRVVLKDGKVVSCQLNYNFLIDEVLFIDENGKQMALANPKDVSRVYISNRFFTSSSKGYYEVIVPSPISLVYKWKCNIIPKGKEGALGITSDAPSIYQMNQMSFDSKTWKLDVDNKVVVSVEVIPYLQIKSTFIQVKGEQDFLKAFSGKRAEIKSYLVKTPVDFKKEADLRRLTEYCNSL
jgi:hypothetical protein